MPDRVQILYVDDSELDRDLVRDALEVEHDGFEVTEARNRDEFLAVLDVERFDLVLTDFDILGYQGLQVLDVVKARDPDVPVVVVTGTGSEEVAVEAMKRGASDYVIKSPRHIRRLPITIEQALKAQRAETERKRALAALEESEQRYRALSASLEATVRERTEQLRELASQAALAERDERHRVAGVLHDEVQQLLYSLRMRLPLLLRADRPAELPDAFAQTLDRAIEATRTLTVDLSPPILEGEGLPEALRWLAAQMERLHGLDVAVEVADGVPALDPARRVLLFQFTRELLFNVVKHAGTDRATARLAAADGRIAVTVADDGAGFDPALADDPAALGFGLSTIRQRLGLFGGDVAIEAAPGAGAAVTLTMPARGARAA